MRSVAQKSGGTFWTENSEATLATARTLALCPPVDRAQQRFGNLARMGSAPALPSPEKRGSATKPCSAEANAA